MSRKLLAIVAFAAWTIAASAADTGVPREYEVKAGYLRDFAEFIEWPADAFADKDAPIILGVLGEDRFGAALERLEGRKVAGRRFEIRRFKGIMEFRGKEPAGRRSEDLTRREAERLQELKRCHILFISASERNWLSHVLKPMEGASVLTVGENPAFTHQGGIVTFYEADKKIQLEINLDAAERARLKISSKLLDLAKVIRNEPAAPKK